MSRVFWRSLGAMPECWSGSLGVARASAVPWPATGIPIANGQTYFPRARARPEIRSGNVRFDTDSHAAVLVSNVLHGYEALDNVVVSAGGRILSPLAQNDLSKLFVAPSDGSPVKWSVSFNATSPELVDIVAFERSPGDSDAPDCGEMR
jgi:hypothetical protein